MDFGKSVAVFGGSGFVGTALVERLSKNHNMSIISADIVDPRVRRENVTYVHCDVRDPIRLPFDVETVFNFAAIHRTPGHADAEYYDTNVSGALNICDFCSTTDVNTLVFTSSISVYGPSEEVLTESSILLPNSAYGKSKLMAESIHGVWKRAMTDRRLIIIRPAVIFGSGEGGNFDRLLRSINGRYFAFAGRRDTIKSCGYVGELIRTIEWALAQSDNNLLFNFSYPNEYTIEDIARTIAMYCDRPIPKLTIPYSWMKFVGWIGDRVFAGTSTRMMKLVASTNVFPQTLVSRDYRFETNLESGIEAWLANDEGKSVDSGELKSNGRGGQP